MDTMTLWIIKVVSKYSWYWGNFEPVPPSGTNMLSMRVTNIFQNILLSKT